MRKNKPELVCGMQLFFQQKQALSKFWPCSLKRKKIYKQVTGYEEMITSDDKVGGWVKKGQNHDDVILEWSLIEYSKREKKKLGKSVSSASRENLTKIR